MNLGTLGILLGGLLFGVVLGRLHGAIIDNSASDRTLGFYPSAIVSMRRLFRGEFSSVLLSVASVWLPLPLLSSRRKALGNHPN